MKKNDIYSFTLEVDKEDRIDKLLSNYFLEYSRSTIQKWISDCNVKINGKVCNQKDKIKSNCRVSINISSKPEITLIPERIDLEVIDETDDYIVLNKESGIVTHIAPGNYSGTIQNGLYFKYPELADVPRSGIIHRLDKDTSGVMLIARNLSSHNYLTKQLQEQKFEKIYHTLVSGIVKDNFSIDQPIGRHFVNRKKMSVSSKGKSSLSIIKPIRVFDKCTHVQVKIITGRTHQIRVHMSYINNPIIGDKLYGYKKNIFLKSPKVMNIIEPLFGQYLHAYSLSFFDLKTKENKLYIAKYPSEYKKLLEILAD